MQTNKEKAVYQKQWREANPEKDAAINKKWREANKAKQAAQKKQWRAENPEKHLATVKKWREANPEKDAASQRASSAKSVENLTNWYVSSQLAKRKDIHQTPAQLRQYPEIIECFRAIMKLRRMCRIKNKEKS